MSSMRPETEDLEAVFTFEEENITRVDVETESISDSRKLFSRLLASSPANNRFVAPENGFSSWLGLSSSSTINHSGIFDEEELSSYGARRGHLSNPIPMPDRKYFETCPDLQEQASQYDPPSFANVHISSACYENGTSTEAEPNLPCPEDDLQEVVEEEVSKLPHSTSSETQIFHGLENVVKDLKPEYVRWFYKYETDRGIWTPFRGYDSLRIEDRYRKVMHEKIPKAFPNSSKNEFSDGVDPIVVVRANLYEVDLSTWTCNATYWPGDVSSVMRGTWFHDGSWSPLPMEQADQLEEEHMGKFAGIPLSFYSPDTIALGTVGNRIKPVLHRVTFPDFQVDWTSPTEIHLVRSAASYKIMRSVGVRLGFETSPRRRGVRLCRGFHKPASYSDRPQEVNHLVFVIHGIGQKMDTGRIVRNCASFRQCVETLKERYYPSLNDCNQRAEFFPVEWRSSLKLDGDIVESITPQKLVSLRQMLNASAMDIMYYTSSLYRVEIQEALRDEMNNLYSKFTLRDPNFESRGGKVSLLAHSLGAVITYDIVTGYFTTNKGTNLQTESLLDTHRPQNCSFQSKHCNQFLAPSRKQPRGLFFHIEHFFCIGSPLSVFLALRWKEPQNPVLRPYILPKSLCKRVYNIFYASDPVAYRIEPLLNKFYINISPVTVHTYYATSPTKYDEIPRELINKDKDYGSNGFTSPKSEEPLSYFSTVNSPSSNNPEQQSTSSKTLSGNSSRKNSVSNNSSSSGWWNFIKYWKGQDQLASGGDELVDGAVEAYESNTAETPVSPIQTVNDLANDLEYRIDYVLREGNLSSSYFAALTSHTSYWSSLDCASFVLTHLYGHLLEASQENI